MTEADKAFHKGDIVPLTILDMSKQGEGIGRANGLVIFVNGAIPGDEVVVRITQVKKTFAKGVVEDMIRPSDYRETPICPYQDLCGGCTYGNMAYEGELQVKENQVRETLARLGGVDREKVASIVAMTEPYRYRNKAQMALSTGGNHKIKGGQLVNDGPFVAGFKQRGSHLVVDCEDCLLQHPVAAALAETVRVYADEDHATCYDPKYGLGLFRHMVVRVSEETGEVMVIFVINGKGIPNAAKLIGMLQDTCDELSYSLESVYININTENTQEVFGKKTELLAGKPTIDEEMGNLRFEVSPRSFYQVNPAMAAALYDKVLDFAELTGTERVLDLYCGVGTIGLWLAPYCREVIGIESVEEAVLDANRNAVINSITNARFVQGKAERVVPWLLATSEAATEEDFHSRWQEVAAGERVLGADLAVAKTVAASDIVILDPPRKGCHSALLDAVLALAPQKIIYVSCDPATLARDIAYLSESANRRSGGDSIMKGYEVMGVVPHDMFPKTAHVETVCLLSNRKPDARVKIDVDLEDYYRIKDEQKKNKASE